MKKDKPMCCGCYNDADKCDCDVKNIREMTPREVLEKLYRQGSFEGEHTELHPDRIASALSDLSEIVMGEMEKIQGMLWESAEPNMWEQWSRHKAGTICDHISSLFTDKEEVK